MAELMYGYKFNEEKNRAEPSHQQWPGLWEELQAKYGATQPTASNIEFAVHFCPWFELPDEVKPIVFGVTDRHELWTKLVAFLNANPDVKFWASMGGFERPIYDWTEGKFPPTLDTEPDAPTWDSDPWDDDEEEMEEEEPEK